MAGFEVQQRHAVVAHSTGDLVADALVHSSVTDIVVPLVVGVEWRVGLLWVGRGTDGVVGEEGEAELGEVGRIGWVWVLAFDAAEHAAEHYCGIDMEVSEVVGDSTSKGDKKRGS